MTKRTIITIAVLAAFSLVLMAGSCDVETKTVKLRQLDKKLKKYEGTKWDGLKKKKVEYVVSGNDRVDKFSKQSALVYAAFVQAQHISDIVARDMKKLKKKKNKKAKERAEENLKIAKKILVNSSKNAEKLVKAGQDLVNNYEDLISDVTKAPAILKALQDSIKNLYKVIEESPDLIKKLTKQIKAIIKA